jgi:hypothetical protein
VGLNTVLTRARESRRGLNGLVGGGRGDRIEAVTDAPRASVLMNVSLAEALDHVDLEAGRVYRCRVKGLLVELHVLGPGGDPGPSPPIESDTMLDPWAELPRPGPSVRIRGRAGRMPPPDVPGIPTDDDPP